MTALSSLTAIEVIFRFRAITGLEAVKTHATHCCNRNGFSVFIDNCIRLGRERPQYGRSRNQSKSRHRFQCYLNSDYILAAGSIGDLDVDGVTAILRVLGGPGKLALETVGGRPP